MFKSDYEPDPVKHMTFWLMVGLDAVVVAWFLYLCTLMYFTPA